MMSEEEFTRNRDVKWTWVQYITNNFYTVRKIVEYDYCHFNTQTEAEAFIKRCEETKDFDDD